MTIKWFDASEAEKFGHTLAKLFLQKLPNPSLGRQRKSINIQSDVIDKINTMIENFKLTNKLNIYKKAMLGRAFKFDLLAAGHNPKFVDQVTLLVMKKI